MTDDTTTTDDQTPPPTPTVNRRAIADQSAHPFRGIINGRAVYDYGSSFYDGLGGAKR